jgi:hypothetical protein
MPSLYMFYSGEVLTSLPLLVVLSKCTALVCDPTTRARARIRIGIRNQNNSNTTKIQKMEVFILAGQSNMAGRGAITAQLIGDAYLNGLKVMRFSAANEWEIGVEPMHKDVDLRKVRQSILIWFGRIVHET